MSTHNIGFYEDLTKIIFELSSNIIKYAPYFFCWHLICSSVKLLLKMLTLYTAGSSNCGSVLNIRQSHLNFVSSLSKMKTRQYCVDYEPLFCCSTWVFFFVLNLKYRLALRNDVT